MRSVLMFCPQFRPIVGGAERQAEKQAKALVRRGVRVTVLTPKFVLDTPHFEVNEGVAIHRFPFVDLCRTLPWVRGLGSLNLLLLRWQVIRAVERHLANVDVLHTHIASPMTAFAMQAAQHHGLPVLCKVANAGPPSDLERVEEIGLGGRLIRQQLQDHMTCWVATTQAVKQSLQVAGVCSDRIVTIPNGVEFDSTPVHAIKSGPSWNFLYLGRLSRNIMRDTPTLIRAFDRLADDLPDAQLALVGAGDQYDETAKIVEQCRHSSRIHLPGQSDSHVWLTWADFFVLPSRREGLSNALLEAMAAGLPCIANDIPPNREVLDNGKVGMLVPVGDEEQLYSAMLKVAIDTNYAEAMRSSAKQRIEKNYGIDAVADCYTALYENLIELNKPIND